MTASSSLHIREPAPADGPPRGFPVQSEQQPPAPAASGAEARPPRHNIIERSRGPAPLPYQGGRLQRALKRALVAIFRPGLVDVERRLISLEWAISRNRPVAWRGGLSGALRSPYGDPRLERRLRDELAYWRRAAAADDALHETLGRWQAGRMAELAEWLNLDTPEDIAAWQGAARALEVGAGPHPFLLAGRWKTAIAIDPLADGYRAEGLLPDLGPIISVAAAAEEIPLPAETADFIACDNCLDHVDDPGAVVGEMRRLLAPGGLLWLLVDLRAAPDEMHPHAFTATAIREMLLDAGLTCVRDREGPGGADPAAQREYRGLWRCDGADARNHHYRGTEDTEKEA